MLIPFDYLLDKFQIKNIPGVLHLGANTGQEAETYAKLGIKEVIWVEALPSLFRKLQYEIARYPGQVACCACVGDEDNKEVEFNVANNGGQSSSYLQFGTHSKEHPTVKFTSTVKMRTVRVDTLFKDWRWGNFPGWLVNADLQGAELLALKGMGELLWHFRYAYIEVNDKELYKGCALTPEIDAYLLPFGFYPRETKMTGAGWGDRFYIRNPGQ